MQRRIARIDAIRACGIGVGQSARIEIERDGDRGGARERQLARDELRRRAQGDGAAGIFRPVNMPGGRVRLPVSAE